MIIALFIINRVSRRSMMITGYIGTTTAAHTGVGLAGILLPADNALRPWLPLVFIVAFIAMMQGTIGPLSWLMISEIFPLRMRGLMIGASALVLWLTNAAISPVFPSLVAGGIRHVPPVRRRRIHRHRLLCEIPARNRRQKPRGVRGDLQSPNHGAPEEDDERSASPSFPCTASRRATPGPGQCP
jgi:hypothetical protein